MNFKTWLIEIFVANCHESKFGFHINVLTHFYNSTVWQNEFNLNLRIGILNHECEFKLNWVQPKWCWSKMTGRGIFSNAIQINLTVTQQRHFSSPTFSFAYHKFCYKTLLNTQLIWINLHIYSLKCRHLHLNQIYWFHTE